VVVSGKRRGSGFDPKRPIKFGIWPLDDADPVRVNLRHIVSLEMVLCFTDKPRVDLENACLFQEEVFTSVPLANFKVTEDRTSAQKLLLTILLTHLRREAAPGSLTQRLSQSLASGLGWCPGLLR
jgi:hypothetical protein